MKALYFAILVFFFHNLAIATEAKNWDPYLEKLFNQGQTALNMAHNPNLSQAERSKFLNDSISAFKNMLEKNPHLPRVHLELARAFFLAGDDLSAKRQFLLILSQNPPEAVAADIKYFLAVIEKRNPTLTAQELLQNNRPLEALAELRRLTEIHPDNLDIFFLLGKTALELAHKPNLTDENRHKLLNEAIYAFQYMLQKNPDLPRVQFELARTYFLQGNDLAAKKYFDLILEKKEKLPTSVAEDINSFLSTIEMRNPIVSIQELIQENRQEEALSKLRELTETHPNNLDIFFLFGKTALDMAHQSDLTNEKRQELLNEAIHAFQYMLQKNPNLPRIQFELARTHFLLGNDLPAKKYFDLILEKKEELPTSVAKDISNFLSAIEERNPTIYAQELLQENRPNEALTELQRLTDAHPDNLDIFFFLGETSLRMAHNPVLTEDERNKLLDEAIRAFEYMLAQDPELHRVQLELARAYFLKGNDALAKKHFKSILADEPPGPVSDNIDRFLSTINQRKPWQIRVTVSTTYDNNIGSGSGNNIIEIYNLPFVLNNEQEEIKSGMGLSLQVGGEYQHQINDRYRLRTGGDIAFKTWPQNNEFDTTSISAYVGPSFSINNSGQMSILATLSNRFKGANHTPSSRDVGLRIETSHQINARLTVKTQTYWYDRSYNSSKELNGAGGDISVNIYYQITPTLQGELAFGYGYDNPTDSKWRQKRNSIEFGLSTIFMENFVVAGNVGIKNSKYEGNWRPYTDGTPRKDKLYFFRINVSRQNYSLLGFKPQFYITNEKLRSNAQLYSHNKIYAGINFTRTF